MGLYVDLPDGRSALYVDLPHGRSALVAGTFWNWFQPIPIEVHPLHVMIWLGEASIASSLIFPAQYLLIKGIASPCSKGTRRKRESELLSKREAI